MEPSRPAYTRAFAAKWLPTDPPPEEPLLGTPDLQSLADLGSSFDLIRQMTIVPIAKSQILLNRRLGGAAIRTARPRRVPARSADHRQHEDGAERLTDRRPFLRSLAVLLPFDFVAETDRSTLLDLRPRATAPAALHRLLEARMRLLHPLAGPRLAANQQAGTSRRAARGCASPRARPPTPAGWPAAPTDRSRRRGARRAPPSARPR